MRRRRFNSSAMVTLSLLAAITPLQGRALGLADLRKVFGALK